MNKTSFNVFGRMGQKSIVIARNCCKQIIALAQTNSSPFSYNNTIHVSLVMHFVEKLVTI